MPLYMRAERKSFSRKIEEHLIAPLLKQRISGQMCDAVIKLNGYQYHAHRAILALWSPYFLSMFTCEMQEKCNGEVDLTRALLLEDEQVKITL